MDIKNIKWHTKSIEESRDLLETDIEEGLSVDEAASRLEKYGYNELEQKDKKSLLSMIMEQFKDMMIIVLIVASIISGALGELTDTFIILAIVIINAVIGVVQESKAEKSMEALKNMAAPSAKVIRNNTISKITAKELVVGDIVILETGDYVPADLRLVENANLKMEEAVLTGESVPVEKDLAVIEDEEAAIGDRINLAYSSSVVSYGRGKGIVVNTGMNSEIGRVAQLIQSIDQEKTGLQKKLEQLGKILALVALGICALIFLVGVLYGKEPMHMFMTAVSLAVAAIPEGLPAIVTIVLAMGVQRMVKRNAIIRKLPSVETLGSATIICSDKTGTLTQNKMTVRKLYINESLVDEEDISISNKENMVINVGVLCNDTRLRMDDDGSVELFGDPTETALVDLAYKKGIHKKDIDKEYPRVLEVPFDSVRKRMTTVHSVGDKYFVLTKGGTDEVLSCCTRIDNNGKIREFTQKDNDKIENANEDMATTALRVLAMAYKVIDKLPEEDFIGQLENNLIFAGLQGMIDPPREEVKVAVEKCKKAGIRPIMITGDHKSTAVAIAKELGILGDEHIAITGVDLDKLSDEELRNSIKDISVYARVSPEHKVRIVSAWQSWGEIVAMTGDGVNDAPALKIADIGSAMGNVGTDVAKEASDMILVDDNFATIVSAIEEGRVIYSNILKAIQFLLSCNVGEILLLFIATMLNWADPLLPIHILWVNLVTDSLPALALGVDPPDKGVMDRKPRKTKEGFFTKGMILRIFYQGLMVGGLALLAFILGSQFDVNPKEPIIGRTMAFLVLAFSQLVHVFNVRSNTVSIFVNGIFANIKLFMASAISICLQLFVVLVPFMRDIFKVAKLDGEQWLIVIALSLAPVVIVELMKLFKINDIVE